MSVYVTISDLKSGPSQTFRFSGSTCEKGGNLFDGVLVNAPGIAGKLKNNETGNQVREISVSINNADALIGHSVYLWGATVTVEIDGVSEVWQGILNRFSTNAQRILTFVAIEDSYAIFKQKIPDEVARIGTFSNMHADFSNIAIPTVFGGKIELGGGEYEPVKVRGILVDKGTSGAGSVYILASGELLNIARVYQDREDVTAKISSGAITISKGAANAALYPGFAYVKFTADPRDASGKWPEIYADVIGVSTVPQGVMGADSRNPAYVLKALLTTASTGPCGWGLGISSDKIDATSFAQAVTDCDTFGFKIDGILSEQRPAAWWVDQICRACRGNLVFEGGKYKFYIAKDSASIGTYDAGNMSLTNIGRGSVADRRNRVTVEYRLSSVTGNWVGTAIREDAAHMAIHGLSESKTQLLLVRDHTTAGKIADYQLRLDAYGADRIAWDSLELLTGMKVGSVITVNRPDLGINNALFMVETIDQKAYTHSISARSYDPAVFGNDALGDVPADPALQASVGSVYRPGAATGLTLTQDLEQMADGKTNLHVDGTFTVPEGYFLYAAVQYGIGANPTNWKTVGNTVDGTFKIPALQNNTTYSVRVTPYNTSGAGEAVTGTITTGIDATIPPTPVISTAATTGGIVVTLTYADQPADFGGFQIARAKANGTSETTINADAVTRSFVDNDAVMLADYSVTWKYRVRARDWSGNYSPWSGWTTALAPEQVDTKDLKVNSIVANRIASGVIQTCHLITTGISADCVKTGALVSTNYGGGSGSCFDLNAGTLTLGGSCAPKLSWNGCTLAISGTVTAEAGSIGGWTIGASGLYAGSGASRVELQGGCGIWAGAEARDSAPFRVTPAGSLVAASATITGTVCAAGGHVGGWVLGQTTLSACKVSIQSGECPTMIFYENGSGADYLTVGRYLYTGYDAGWVCATGIAMTDANANSVFELSCRRRHIAGWNFNTNSLYKHDAAYYTGIGQWAGFAGYGPHFYTGHASGCQLITIGRCLFECGWGWIDRYGMVINTGGKARFGMYSCCDGTCPVSYIAGWNFDEYKLHSGDGLGANGVNLVMSRCSSNGVFYAHGGYLQGYGLTWWYPNNAGHLVLGQIAANAGTICDNWRGLQMMDHAGQVHFQLAVKQGANCFETDHRIGGWRFNHADIWNVGTGSIATSGVAGSNRVIMDCCGLRGYDSVLGETFNIPTSGAAPCFASGVIKSTIFEINTNAVMRTSANALNNEAGFLINNTGIFASDASTCGTGNAKVKILPDGTFYLGGATPKLSWNGSALCINGDIEVASNGNILPDPDFAGVPFSTDETSFSSGQVVGDWVVYDHEGTGGAGLIGYSKGTWRQVAYGHDCSNGIWLYAAGSGHAARFESKNFIPVKAGQTYTLSGYVANHPGYNCPNAYLGFTYYDSSFAAICYSYPVFGAATLTSAPVRYCGTKTMPSNAAYVKVIAYNYWPAGPSYVYFGAFQLEEGSTATAWKNKAGKITADQIFAGQLSSINWGSSAGSQFDLNAGTFKLGGSSAPKLAWDGSNLCVCGAVCATSGTFTGTVCACDGCFLGAINPCGGVVGGWTIGNGYLCHNTTCNYTCACGCLCVGYAQGGRLEFRSCCYIDDVHYKFSCADIRAYECAIDFNLWSVSCCGLGSTYYRLGLQYASYCGGLVLCNSNILLRGSGTICACSGNVWAQAFCTISDRTQKCDISLADCVLPALRSLPIYTYRYCADEARAWHLGIMADDFQRAVPWMGDGKGIPSLGSFALKAAQELDRCVDDLKARIAALEARLAA